LAESIQLGFSIILSSMKSIFGVTKVIFLPFLDYIY